MELSAVIPSLRLSDLDFFYPEELVGLAPQRPSRVMWCGDHGPEEISIPELLQRIPTGDLLILNETKVIPRRIFSNEHEILFLSKSNAQDNLECWLVLMPSRKMKIGEVFELPGGVRATLLEKGRPQILQVSKVLSGEYFSRFGELALPPYIQKARGERHTQGADQDWYQTAWAKSEGSLASPTASLHFSARDLQALRARGVNVEKLTLHVGLGTFLPVTVENLSDHVMHSEWVDIPGATWAAVKQALAHSKRVWALGTTVTRALESAANGLLPAQSDGGFAGGTQLFIQPGYQWQVVSGMLTNFHQPQSTLLALVAGFSDLGKVKNAYAWAINRRFRLFSYGDLSVWTRPIAEGKG